MILEEPGKNSSWQIVPLLRSFLPMISGLLHQDKPLIESRYNMSSRSHYLLIHIITEPVQKKSSYKSLGTIECRIQNDSCFYQNEKVLIYFKGEKPARRINSSSWIITDKV